ncbi:MAG: putative NAD-dependent malic enzyme 3 [Pseudomonadota bacterium]
MLHYEIKLDPNTGEEWIETGLRGKALLTTFLLNKGTAFSYEERCSLGLLGKLPMKIETLEEQVRRAYRQYQKYKTNIQRNIYLNSLHDKSETLFYKLLSDHLEEMLPMVYTPAVGQAVKQFSHEFRQARGLYIAYPDADKIDIILNNRTNPDIEVIVVTDGERVLGLGDQGVGGMDIPIAKLMLYTACAGINPYKTLPIMLDVGTNNPRLLRDPLYLGWRHGRIKGPEYDAFIDRFVQTVKKQLPGVLLQWEDFGRDNARRLLEKYRYTLCSFNDDMQGTAVVTLSAILTGVRRSGIGLTEQRIVIFGAGTAGVGIADQLVFAMEREGLTRQEAKKRLWLVDKEGLLNSQMTLVDFQRPYVRDDMSACENLLAVVRNVKPSLLIGCSSVRGAFTEEIIKIMANSTKYPIILPLSNPNEQSEAHPNDLLAWTNGQALIATGSPFQEVVYQGKKMQVAQSNNALCFPGLGLGVVVSRAKWISDNMLWAAVQALTQYTLLHAKGDEEHRLLPSLKNAREVAKHVAFQVAEAAREEGLAQFLPIETYQTLIEKVMWEPYYRPIRPKEG